MTVFHTAVALAAVLAAAPAPRRELPVAFVPGEKLTYDVSWSSYLTAGTATVQVVEKKPSYGSTAYYIVAEGRPAALLSALYTLYYKVDTLLDVFTLLPQRASVYSQEGKRHRMKTTMFDRRKGEAEFSVETRSVVRKTLAISPEARDPLSALYVLRSTPLNGREQTSMAICDNGNTYRVLIRADRKENVQTALGSIAAQHLTLTPPPESGARAIDLWLSTDAAHVPIKMSADLPVGAFVLTLTSRS